MNKNWLAIVVLGIGTFLFGVVALLTSVLVSQKSYALVNVSNLTTLIDSPTVTPTPIRKEGPCIIEFSTLPNSTPVTSKPLVSRATTSSAPSNFPQAACLAIKVYTITGEKWTLIRDISHLQAGKRVAFAVIGATTQGLIDQGRFQINATSWVDTTLVNPYGEYYYIYELPAGITHFTVTGQVHHLQLGWI